MTVLELLRSLNVKIPSEIWNGRVYGPMSYDDLAEIRYWYQETEKGPKIHGRITFGEIVCPMKLTLA